ncbi:hypothetical protein JVU11DRAFT_1891 [Chiua virens]|nr:hypothetical protein JVU11DRAFT_1891 [Chiua virens]
MATPDVDSEDQHLSTIENLILAQAVYEHGADAWQTVSALLAKHPALVRPTQSLFTPQSCHRIYVRLMNEASLECSDTNNTPYAPLNLSLAQRHYSARLLHLRNLIAAEEHRFKSLVAEIDEIRSGAWDDKIRVKLAADDGANANDAVVSQPLEEPIAEPQQLEVTTNDLVSTDDQTLIQNPEKEVTEVRVDDETTQQSKQTPVEEPSDTLVDNQTATSPPEEDTVLESAPANVPEISEESAIVENLEAGELVPETAQMDIEESPVLQDSEDKTNEKSPQREAKRKVTDPDSLDEQRDKKKARDEFTPTDADEPAYASRRRSSTNSEIPSQHQTPPSVPNKRFQTVISMLHSQISQHRNGNIFHNPIKNSEAPDYHDIIKRPMDLKTIKAKVKDGVISNSLEFQRDVYLMFANAMMYNRPGSDIYHMAEEMMAESEVHINTFRQTEGFIRSTRS